MAEEEVESGTVDITTNVGVPTGPKFTRTKSNIDTPLSEEELKKFEALLGPQTGIEDKIPERGTPLVVVADDDPDARFFESRALAQFDFACVEVEDGKEALKKVLADRPDLLLVDLKMPGLDGFEVIRGVRSYLKFRKVMIVVMTSLGTVGNEVSSFALGADDFIVKPVNKKKLAAKMEAIRRRLETNKNG